MNKEENTEYKCVAYKPAVVLSQYSYSNFASLINETFYMLMKTFYAE